MIKSAEKRLYLIAFAGVALSLLAPFLIVWGYLSYHAVIERQGYCERYGRILSDEAKIDRVIHQVNDRSTIHLQLGGSDPVFKRIPYQDIAAFKAANPACCTMENFPQSTSNRVVRLRFKDHYVDGEGKPQSHEYDYKTGVTPCGEATEVLQ